MADQEHDRVDTIPGRYYARREPPGAVEYGESYWRGAVDPDGLQRDRTKERSQHLGDLRHELDFVNSLPPGRIVDIGCGLGFFLSGVDDDWEKHGVELSDFAISRARRWGRIVTGPVERVGFPSGHFDVVLMHHVIEHLERPEQTITEVRRILAPGGWLVLGAPDFDSGCARRFGPRYRLLSDPSHISLFTTESMHRFLRDHGFLVEHVDYPYFETRHFSEENLLRLMDATGVSPPFYGNFMTFYCRKPTGGMLTALLQRLGSYAPHELTAVDAAADDVLRRLTAVVEAGGRTYIDAGIRTRWLVDLAHSVWQEEIHVSDDRCRLGAREMPELLGEGAPGNEDVVLCFRLDPDGSQEIPKFGRATTIVICEEGAARGEVESCPGMLQLPLHYGQHTAAVEAAVLAALIRELWLRPVLCSNRNDDEEVSAGSGGGES